MQDDRDPVVLAVDDDEAVLDTYRLWLLGDCEVRTASDGETALNRLDEAVDVVLLDRMMPGLSGREVLDRVRERDEDPVVVMLTALDPDYDVVDMPFDAYLTKPTTKEELTGTIDLLVRRDEYTDDLREYYSFVERAATLEANKPAEELAEDERYRRLDRHIEELEGRLGDRLEMDHEEFVVLARDI